jgi:hypothetical protein
VILPLGALLARAQLLESAGVDLVEEAVQKIRRLIASEESALFHESRELQHDLLTVADAGHNRLNVSAAEPTREVRHGRVEVSKLRRRDKRDEQEHKRYFRPESHGLVLHG